MSRRPRIAFIAGLAPYPPPLIGATLRIGSLIRELQEEFEVAFVCLSEVDSQTIRENWKLGRSPACVVAVPRPLPLGRKDALWGSVASCLKAAVVTTIPGQRPRMFDWAWSPEFIAELRRVLRELNIDVVWATKIWMAEMARAAGAKHIIVDNDDFQGTLMTEELSRNRWYKRKALHSIQARNLVRYERRLLKRFDAAVICKSEDAALVESSNGARLHVVPNGIDVPDTVNRTNVGSSDMLFVGTLSWPPNIDAVTELVQQTLPLVRREVPTARLIVAGRGPVPDDVRSLFAADAAELHESPLSLEEFYSRTAISVAPLATGGGTSIKVLESLAHAIPTVASSVAARGLGLVDGKHLRIADTVDEFATACIRLLRHPDEAAALGLAGREEVMRRFSWKTAGVSARDAVRRLLSGVPPNGTFRHI